MEFKHERDHYKKEVTPESNDEEAEKPDHEAETA